MMPANSTTGTISIHDILRNALDGIFVVDRQRRFILFSDACERITGYPSSELVGAECHCRDVLQCRDEHDRPLTSGLCPVKALFDATSRSSRLRMCLRRKNGASVCVETIYTPVSNEAGQVEFVLGVIRDITEGKTREENLMEQIAQLRQRLDQGFDGPRTSPLGTDSRAPAGHRSSSSEWNVAPQNSAVEHPADPSLSLDPILAGVEREAIRRALRSAKWQRNKAAQLMGISRSRLYRRMEALGIDPNDRK